MKKVKIKQILNRAEKKDLYVLISYEEKYGGTTYTMNPEDIILEERTVKLIDDCPELIENIPYQDIRWMKCCRK
ncbi:hypothetical protein [Clostridium perfringens]|uniref:hypothetical protein n=1 Tax=Clostridium perfringens TaxID=1502 RepID=UPI00096A6467|nr:hypothetical protein [Clostridium perfringens]